MSRRRLAPALLLLCVVAGPLSVAAQAESDPPPPSAGAEEPVQTAEYWMGRIRDALRIDATLSGRARVEVDRPGQEQDFAFEMQLLRETREGTTRTVFEMREDGDDRSIASELIEKEGEPLTSWYWDLQKRRWVRIRGIQPTDAFADTSFRYEDLWLTEPRERRRGTARWVEEGGRRYVDLVSEPYHYYQRVETRVDPESGLPVSVRFFDNAGALFREQHYEKTTLIDDRPFPTVVRIRDHLLGGETVVTYGELRFDRRIPPSFFDLSVMDDRMRRGVDPVPNPPDLR